MSPDGTERMRIRIVPRVNLPSPILKLVGDRTVHYDDCPPGYYERRTYRSYGRGGRYYETTYYEY